MFFNPIINECDFGFIVNRVLKDIGSLTKLKTKIRFWVVVNDIFNNTVLRPMELRKSETNWKLVKLNGFLGIDLMLVSAFEVNT